VTCSQAASGGSQLSGHTTYHSSPPAVSPPAAPVSDVLPYAPRPPMDWSLRTCMRFFSNDPLRLCEDATLASGTLIFKRQAAAWCSVQRVTVGDVLLIVTGSRTASRAVFHKQLLQ
jgi:hypothetical protein